MCGCSHLRCLQVYLGGNICVFARTERSPYGSQENVRWKKNVTHWRQNADRVDKYVLYIKSVVPAQGRLGQSAQYGWKKLHK